MKKFSKITFIIALVAMLFATFTSASVGVAQTGKITTTPSGYTSADQVQYKTYSGTIANWGARGENATFLSKHAQSFYSGSNTLESFVKLNGDNYLYAPQSPLYSALKSFMASKHTHQTAYQETRDLYKYTDCERNDVSHISSFYSGGKINGNWGSSPSWNREHTWPNSKGLGGNDENDIMMLRPTLVSENSSRGNTAYGTRSNGYFDPGVSVRGDCARIVLYIYVRWGNTSKMWGESGVMENVTVLLQWMAEDPVDTWEMARNDAVQSITGTRNVFIDYPELAWKLFNQRIPTDIQTPSGYAQNQTQKPIRPSSGNKNNEKTIWLIVGIVGGVVVVGGVAVVVVVTVKRRNRAQSAINNSTDE